MRVFLSYTRNKDQFLKVTSFRERFEAEIGIREPRSSVFQDKENLREGEHFPEVISEELERSDVLLVLMSPAWLASEWCRKEFDLFTDGGTNDGRLHKILPVLWVDTPEMSIRSVDPIARTMARINYSDWRDLRYEGWDDPRNQRQLGRLAESAIALRALKRTPTASPRAPNSRSSRLSEEKERLLLALVTELDGLPEDKLARKAKVTYVRTSVAIHELQAAGYVRNRSLLGLWVLNTPGKAYLLEHNLAA